MKQNESIVMYVLRLAGTLLLICAVTAGLLAMAFMGFSGVDKGLGVLFGIE